VSAPPERAREVLEARARALARPLAAPRSQETVPLVTFALAGETYGIAASHVLGIFRLVDMAPLPGATAPVAGVTAWRGELLLILDLRRPLGLPVDGLDDLAWAIALGREGAEFGLLAQKVNELVQVAATDIGTPAQGVAADRAYLRGITRDAVLVLDADALLRMPHWGGSL